MKNREYIPPLRLPPSLDCIIQHFVNLGYVRKEIVQPYTLTSGKWADVRQKMKMENRPEGSVTTGMDILQKWSSKERRKTEIRER
jgi:hypothetical protein